MTSGPVTNIYAVDLTIRMKSVMAGEYTAPPAHGPMIDDDAVAGNALLLHAEIEVAMNDELIELLERAGIEEQRDAFARDQFSFVVLAVDALLSAAKLTLPLAALEFFESRFESHRLSSPRFARGRL